MSLRVESPLQRSQLPLWHSWLQSIPDLIAAYKQELPSFLATFEPILARSLSWGVWDGVEMVGAVIFEPITYPGDPLVRDGVTHFALSPTTLHKGALLRRVFPSLIDAAFSSIPHLLRMSAWIVGERPGMVRLVEAMGFRWEGTLRASGVVNGETQNTYLYGLTRNDFYVHDADESKQHN